MSTTETSSTSKKINRVLQKIGLSKIAKITDTLQGSIWRGVSEGKDKSMSNSVVKVTDQTLHRQSVSVINNQRIQINENILVEQSILKFLTQHKSCPPSIVKYRRFFQSNTNYFLEMEDGGICLVDFINSVIQMNGSGQVIICNWQAVVGTIFKQLVECIDFLHSLNVCHFDISLENILINDVILEVHKCGDDHELDRAVFDTSTIQIKLCDFGLAGLFTSSECKSSKFCGKRRYKSPEMIYRKRGLNAKKNDIWALGVCLMTLYIGNPLWNAADGKEQIYVDVMNGGLVDVLNRCSLLDCFDMDLLDLFQSIFQYENDRINISQIKKHPWFGAKCERR
eukprot:276006_1